MSQGQARPFDEMAPLAVELLRLLEPACERVKIAGSLRRRRRMIGDIEYVAIARIDHEEVPGFFAEHSVSEAHDRLLELLERLRDDEVLAPRLVEVHRADGRLEHQYRLGQAYQALVYRDVPVDLFIVRPPACWGVLYALRTGPGDWNRRLVEECKRYGRRVENGQVLYMGKPIDAPEEADFFRLLGQPWVEPPSRSVEMVHIDPAIIRAQPVPA